MIYLYYLLAAMGGGLIGGAIGGIIIGGKDLGYDLAAMMGAFYGLLPAISGIAIALLALNFL